MPIVTNPITGAYSGQQGVSNKLKINSQKMKKIILTTIIPFLIVFPIAIFLGIKQYTSEVPSSK